MSATPLARKQQALGLDRLPLANGGRAVEVFRTGAVHVNGRADEDAEELPGLRGPLGIRSHVLAPIEVAGARRGVLAVSSTVADAFSDAHVRLVRVFAHWTGLVAHRAEVVEQLAVASRLAGRRSAAEELVTVVAHDLRNYVGPVHGRLHLLRERAVREARAADQRDADAGLRSLERLIRVLTDLLDVGRIEQGLLELDREPLDLVALVRGAIAAVQLPGRSVSLHAPPELVIDGDGPRLRQAIDNVLSNSTRYTPEGAAVRVALAQDAPARQAVLEIADEGPGIEPAVAARLFTRFSRGTGSQGLGLGLFLAREIATAHGGSLDVRSVPGRGTTFVFRLPTHAS